MVCGELKDEKAALLRLTLVRPGGRISSHKTPPVGQTTMPLRPSNDQNRIKVRVELVNVLTTVTDKKNRLVTDLTKDDFRIFEDGKPQDVASSAARPTSPYASGSWWTPATVSAAGYAFEQEAAIDFLNIAR